MKSNSLNPYSAPVSSVEDLTTATPSRLGTVIGCLFMLPPAAFVSYLVYFSISRGQIGVLPNYLMFVAPLGLIVYFGAWWQKHGLNLARANFFGVAMLQGFALMIVLMVGVFVCLFIKNWKLQSFTHRDITPTLIGLAGSSVWMFLMGSAVRSMAKRYQKKA